MPVQLLLVLLVLAQNIGSNSAQQQYSEYQHAVQQQQQCSQQPGSSSAVPAAPDSCPLAHAVEGHLPGLQTEPQANETTAAAGPGGDCTVEGSSSSSRHDRQCESGTNCEWDTFIVRFSQYKMVSEHKSMVQEALAHMQQHWVWLDRANKAVLQYPSDFALLSVARPQLQQVQQELAHVPGFKDMTPDRRIRGLLNWQPQEPLAGAFSNIHPQQQQSALKQHPASLRLQQEPAFGQQSQQQHQEDVQLSRLLLADGDNGDAAASPAADPAALDQQQPQQPPSPAVADDSDAGWDSRWTVSKPPGRLTTRPTIGLDPKNPADREESLGKEELRRRRRRTLLDWRGLLGSLSSRRGRRLAAGSDTRVTTMMEAGKLWEQGHSGKGIKVGVFDTGIREGHPHIRNIKERTNWTHQASLSDGLGHGSFVAGVIGSQDTTCPGFAPDVELYTFKVFTDDQVSYTSWFLDAFNYAIASKLHVINLSIGGPDFLDAPFVEKVWEVTSNGLIMISAIGNDGPLYGTLNNPADQPDVIGVGGIDNNDHIASFSSRGMTTWELPAGTGRIKPDVMAYAKDVTGSKIQTGCRSLSGTSVASPVVAGAVCLLASTLPDDKRWMLNPASMKQALVEGSVRLPGLNMHEQGNGRINLPASQAVLASYTPRASLIPPAIHLADCPYMWPHCKQHLYAFALPVVLNATVVNGMGNTGYFDGPPVYKGSDEGGKMLHVTFKYSDVLWPWSGYLAIYVQVSPAAWNFSGNASGTISFTITSPPQLGSPSKAPQTSKVVVPLSAVIRPTPPRNQRIIWDVLHSIKYPPGYVPRDNLDVKSDVLDWHGDHPFTNFHEAYDALRDAGFFVEIMSSPGTCFDPENYGGYLVVDAEEEWYKEEVDALAAAVKESGMALVVFAEWYHEESLKQMKFFDDNTRSWWTPITGGANVPALNDLLAPHSITLGERILQGTASFGTHSVQVLYGANIASFPAGGHLHVVHLTDVAGKGAGVPGDYAAFGITASGKGQVAVMGDSNCLDSSHNMGPCFEFLVALFQQLLQQKSTALTPTDKLLQEPFTAPGFTAPPQRRADVNFTRYSWVLQNKLTCAMSAPCHYRQPSDCPKGPEWQHKHLQPGSEPEQTNARQPAAVVQASPGVNAKQVAEPTQTQQPQQQKQKQLGAVDEEEDGQQQQQPEQQQAKNQASGAGQQSAPASGDGTHTGQQGGNQGPAAAAPSGQTAEQDLLKETEEHPDKMVAPEQQQQQPGSSTGTSSSPVQQHKQHSAMREEQAQQSQRRAFISQAMSLATFICVAGVVGVVVMWRMRANGSPRKWGRKWGYGPVRRSPTPLDV